MNERLKNRAENFKPAKKKPLRVSPRDNQSPTYANAPFRPTGTEVWHGVTGYRFAFPLPSISLGPIRARDIRRKKGREGY